MSLKEYIENIEDIYHKYGIFWSWLYKVINRKKIKLNVTDEMNGQEAVNMLITYLLGPDWYVVDPLASCQVNAIAAEDIIRKYRGF